MSYVVLGIRGNKYLNFLSTGCVHSPHANAPWRPASFCTFLGSRQGPLPPKHIPYGSCLSIFLPSLKLHIVYFTYSNQANPQAHSRAWSVLLPHLLYCEKSYLIFRILLKHHFFGNVFPNPLW